MLLLLLDHCRIGSLETPESYPLHRGGRSLPHRQLRNQPEQVSLCVQGSLPHRQLRNISSEAAEEKYWITAA